MSPFNIHALALCILGIPHLVSSGGGCPSGEWEEFEESCYRYVPGMLTSWDNAQDICLSEGGNLASISSLAENTHIYDKMLENNPLPVFNNYWTGMSKDGAGYSYIWVDGSLVTFTSWAPGEPSDSIGEHNCVQEVVDGNQGWDDTDCAADKGFVCETNTECPADWDPYADSCYRYYPEGVYTWDMAELTCTQQDAHLVSITSGEEAIHIHSQMQANNPLPPLYNYWIGLLRQGPGDDFAWVDGTLYEYTQWGFNEPNNQGGNQNCGLVFEDDHLKAGNWGDNECGYGYGYVCKKAKAGKWKKGKDGSMEQVAGQASEQSVNTDVISTGATAGIILGGLVAFVCVGTVVFMLMYRRRKVAQQTPPVESVDLAENHI